MKKSFPKTLRMLDLSKKEVNNLFFVCSIIFSF